MVYQLITEGLSRSSRELRVRQPMSMRIKRDFRDHFTAMRQHSSRDNASTECGRLHAAKVCLQQHIHMGLAPCEINSLPGMSVKLVQCLSIASSVTSRRSGKLDLAVCSLIISLFVCAGTPSGERSVKVIELDGGGVALEWIGRVCKPPAIWPLHRCKEKLKAHTLAAYSERRQC